MLVVPGRLARFVAFVVTWCVVVGVVSTVPASAQADASPVPRLRDVPPIASERAVAPVPAAPEGSFENLPPLEGQPLPETADAERRVPQPVEEVVELRRANEEVWRNDDGTFTSRLTSEAKYFQPEGTSDWVRIDSSLIPEAGREGWVHNAANSWSVAFGPIDGQGAGGVQLTSGDQTVTFAPVDGAAAKPEVDEKQPNVVIYRDVWPGVDVRYTVSAHAVKEDIVVNRPTERARFEFAFAGVSPESAKSGSESAAGAVLLDSADPARRFTLAPATVFDRTGRSVDKQAKPSLAFDETASRLSVTVDDAWLRSLGEDSFPIVVDPSVATASPTIWHAFSDLGYICGSTNHSPPSDMGFCWPRIGNAMYVGDEYFRTILDYNYEISAAYGKSIHSVSLGITGPTGVADDVYVGVYHANTAAGWDYHTAAGSGALPWAIGTVPWTNADAWVDVTALVAPWLRNSNPGQMIGLRDMDEQPGLYTFKEFGSGLSITWQNQPTPAPLVSPAVDAVISTTTPTLSITPGSDADGHALQYLYRLWTGPGPESSQVIDSGWLPATATSWTVPEGSLRDGTTYCWTVRTWDGQVTHAFDSVVASPHRCFKVDLRLGAGGPSPMDQVGPVTVNLATGNVAVSTSTPEVPTVGGSLGVTFTYNSQQRPPQGLEGKYQNDWNNNKLFDEPIEMLRTDPEVRFNWGSGSPGGNIFWDHFLVRWDGYVTTPAAGDWTFGMKTDDGVRLWVDNLTTPIVDRWTVAVSNPIDWATTSRNFTAAGQKKPIRIEYFENEVGAFAELWAYNPAYAPCASGCLVQASWLSTDVDTLPHGWTMSALDADAAFKGLSIGSNSATLQASDGSTYEFKRVDSAVPGGLPGFTPPTGFDDVLALDGAGNYTLQASDGMTYTFDSAGKLAAVISSLDDRQPAATTYNWSIGPSGATQLNQMTDPVSGRNAKLVYFPSGSCPSPLSGGTSPTALLCRIDYYETATASTPYQSTKLFYDASGRLQRIEDPGGEITDFGYDSAGRLTRVRDPLGYDVVAAGERADTDKTRTVIAYDGAGRVASVTQPAPLSDLDAQPTHSYSYNWTTPPALTGTNGQTSVSIAGLSQPNGYARRVTYDPANRQLSDADAAGRATTKVWDAADRIQSVTTADGLKTVTKYDFSHRPIHEYGPAPAGWFDGSDNPAPPSGETVPHHQTGYDEGIGGLAATWWTNLNTSTHNLSGAPKLHTTLGWVGAAFDFNTGSPGTGVSADHFGGRFTGTIEIPSTGNWTLQTNVYSDDGVRMWLDDKLYIDAWAPSGSRTATINGLTAGKHRIRIDYHDATGLAGFNLQWANNGATLTHVPQANLSPDYGLVTSRTDPDGKKTATEYDNGVVHAEHGLATAVIEDPGVGKLNLRTETTYEAPSTTTFFRRTSRRLPSGVGATTTYAYYGNTETRTNPCPSGGSANQSGRLKLTTSPTDSGSYAIEREQVYDTFGRVVASRIVADGSNWTCTTYDTRGRPATVTYPAFGGQPSRTVTYNYRATAPISGATPSYLVSSVNDSAGTIYTKVDLLGRVVDYWDVWGTRTTTTYDQAGRVSNTDMGALGTRQSVYGTSGDEVNQLVESRVDNQPIAQVGYDTVGRLSWVNYLNGTGNAGNGTFLETIDYDNQGKVAKLGFNDYSWNMITRSTVKRSPAGRVIDESVDWVDAGWESDNYAYDGAGRLTGAVVWGHSYWFGYDATSGCPNNNANLNSNRTEMVDNYWWDWQSTTDWSYCYDHADRLTSTDDPAIGTLTYDAHGNTVTIAGETHGYDAADRHVTTNKGGTTVAYRRDATDRIVQRTAASLSNVGSWSGHNGASGNTKVTVNKPAGVQDGDVIVATIAVDGAPTVTPPAGWTAAGNIANGTTLRTVAYTHVAAPGDPTSWDFTWTGTRKAAAAAVAYRGVDPTSPLEIAATATGTGASHAAPSLATSGHGRELINIYAATGTTAFTPAAGTTEQADQQSGTGTGAVTLAVADSIAVNPGSTGNRVATSAASGAGAYLTIALRPNEEVVRYAAGGAGDTFDATLDGTGALLEHTIDLPGGVLVTDRVSGSDTWSYPNIHGDIAAVANEAGFKQGNTIVYDPYGRALDSFAFDGVNQPDYLDHGHDNSAGNYDYGWLGQHQRGTEHQTGLLPIIEMGARQYSSRLGRFLEVDAIEGGTGTNDYGYVRDPINQLDLDGNGFRSWMKKKAKGIKSSAKKYLSNVVYGSNSRSPAARRVPQPIRRASAVAHPIDTAAARTSFTACLYLCLSATGKGVWSLSAVSRGPGDSLTSKGLGFGVTVAVGPDPSGSVQGTGCVAYGCGGVYDGANGNGMIVGVGTMGVSVASG